MSAVCTICALPAPTGLAMLSSCLHSFHTACLRQYVQAHGRCPQPECTRPAGEADIRVLILDPPQPGGGGQRVAEDTTAARVREVLNATYDRLREFATGSDQERAQVAQVGEAFELILRRKGQKCGQPVAEEDSGWDKLLRIVNSKEVKMVVLAVIVAVLCAFFWYLVPTGGLFAGMGETVTAMLATLRAFAPEILGSLAAAGTMAFGFFKSKKLED